MRNNYMYTLLILLFTTTYIYSQVVDPIVCETTTNSGSESTTWGRFKPAQNSTGEYFRVLIAYAQFASDNTEPSNAYWSLNQLPSWKNDIIDTAVTGNYRDQTLSDYFDKASSDNYDFIGDVYQDTIIVPTDVAYGAANKYVIDELNANISDFSRYDNWKFQSGSFVFSEGDGDDYIDMLIIIYRNPHDDFELAGGIASLNLSSLYTTHDDFKLANGISVNTTAGGITSGIGLNDEFTVVGHLAHEFGHYLFGAGHRNFGGLMAGAPAPYETITYMMSAWERTKLGYITPTVPSTDSQQVVLGDFVTEGDVIKIPIPFNNPSSSTFLMVENHQRVSKYDQIMRGESLNGNWNLTTTLGKGLYIWVITNGNGWSPTINIKSADGSWDWAYDGDYYAGPGWYDEDDAWYGYVPQTKRSAVNRNTGKSDRYPTHVFWNNHWAQKWVDINPATGNYELTRDVMGEANDAFNEDYNELFTPWSNPSSYVGGATNISVELVSKSGNNITVKVYSTYGSSRGLAPSKPQDLRVTSVSNHPYLRWEANIEPDLLGYYIWRKENSGAWYNIDLTSSADYTDTEVTTYQQFDTYQYKITAVDSSAKFSVYSDIVQIEGIIPKINVGEEKSSSNEFSLSQNYPNPFNPTTIISYNLPKNSFVTLKVYDVLGKEVTNLVNRYQEKGYYSLEFNASHLPSGVYFYKVTAGNFSEIRKMLLLK